MLKFVLNPDPNPNTAGVRLIGHWERDSRELCRIVRTDKGRYYVVGKLIEGCGGDYFGELIQATDDADAARVARRFICGVMGRRLDEFVQGVGVPGYNAEPLTAFDAEYQIPNRPVSKQGDPAELLAKPGAYYTPLGNPPFDPACGTGGFLSRDELTPAEFARIAEPKQPGDRGVLVREVKPVKLYDLPKVNITDGVPSEDYVRAMREADSERCYGQTHCRTEAEVVAELGREPQAFAKGDPVIVEYAAGVTEAGKVSWSSKEEGTVEVQFPSGSAGMFPARMVIAAPVPIPGPVVIDDSDDADAVDGIDRLLTETRERLAGTDTDATAVIPQAEVAAATAEAERERTAMVEAGAEFDVEPGATCDHQPRPLRTDAQRESSEESGIHIRNEHAAAKRDRIARRAVQNGECG